MPTTRKSKTQNTVEKLSKADLTQKVLDLRRKGYTHREIAVELRITRRQVSKVLDDAYAAVARECKESAEQQVRLQMDRLEWMLKSLNERIEGGHVGSVEAALRILERQAKLLGLDAPTKQEVKVQYSELTDEELLAEAERLKLKPPEVKLLPDATSLPLPGESPEQAAKVIPLLPAPVERTDAGG